MSLSLLVLAGCADPAEAPRAVGVLRQRLSRSSEGLKLEKRPDGTHVVDLQGRFQSATVLFKDSSGVRHQICLDNHEAIERLIGTPSP